MSRAKVNFDLPPVKGKEFFTMKKSKALILITLCLFAIDMIAQDAHQVLNQSNIAFTIPEKDLIPESIAYDHAKGDFYIGSTRKGKIVKLSKTGVLSDFVTSRQDGLWMVIGMKIDPTRNILWVCSSEGENLENYSPNDARNGRSAGVFKYDLTTGRLIKKYILDTPGEVHFLNDLAIADNGDVYVTHMFENHAIYKIAHKEDVLTSYYTSDLISYPNGISLSDDDGRLYVSYAEGIAMIDISTGAVQKVSTPDNLKIAYRESIDGLYFYQNSLIGIHPDIKTVQQFFLNESGTAITNSRLKEVNHPMMNNPTTGELVNDTFYYIANAQFGSFSEEGVLFPLDKLFEVCVLKVPVKF